MQELKFKLYSARRKLLILLCLTTMIILTCVSKVYASSGYDYNPDQNATASFHLPYFATEGCVGETVKYSIRAFIDSGTTNGHTYRYLGHTKLWLENPKSGGEILLSNGPSYLLSCNGSAGTDDTDSGSISFSKSELAQLIDMSTVSSPSISSSGFRTGTVYASASGGMRKGTAHIQLCAYLDDWYGPGDNEIYPDKNGGDYGITDTYRLSYAPDIDHYVDITDTDPIEYYYYTFDNSSYQYKVSSGYYGQGSYFNSPVSTSNAGQYCHVTFYTESGAYVSTVIPIPDLVTLYYNANGGTGAPSSQSVWPGQSVNISSQKPTRTNYEFLGWNTSSAYGDLQYGASVPSGTVTSGSITLYEDRTLYAVWRTVKVPYTLQFKLNGKIQNNDYAYVTGTVNGKQTVSNSVDFL